MTIETETVLLPGVIAASVAAEAARFLCDDQPLGFAETLRERAEACYRNNENFERQIKGRAGRDTLYCFMRHWLAGELKREAPALYAKLPHAFGNGEPLP